MPRDLPPLKVSENGRYLITADGKPFFWLADTAWWIRRLPPDDAEFYLAHRARQGFNVIQVHPGYEEADCAGNPPFTGSDPADPNEPFWRNMDAVVAAARGHGLYVAVVPMWGQEYGKAFGADAAKARRFGQWIARRYAGQSDVLWIVSGEYDSINAFRLPISAEQKAVLNSVAEGLRDVHKGTQLMTIHPGAARTSAGDFHREPWLSFDMLQSGHQIDSEAYGLAENHALIAQALACSPPKPVLDGEPTYEDTPDGVWVHRDVNRPRADGPAVRRKAYWAVFAGACGHTYGHNDVYGFFKLAFPGQVQPLPQGPGQRGNWRASLNAQGATHMHYLRQLIESCPSPDRIPDQSLVVGDAGKGLDHVAAMRAPDGSWAMLYLPQGKPVQVALAELGIGRVRASWFNPRTGSFSPAPDPTPARKGIFDPPTSGEGQDWVLVLEALATDSSSPAKAGPNG